MRHGNLDIKGQTRHTKEHTEKRGKIVISNNLSERPTEADSRSRIGHWEGDNVAGKKNGALSRYTRR